jgi:small-conductance mechanosensitive channel
MNHLILSDDGKEILVPTFEICSNPCINLSEIKSRRFYIVDKEQKELKELMEAIQKEIAPELTLEDLFKGEPVVF